MTIEEHDETLTVDEARAIIGVDKISRGSLYSAIKKHRVPHLRLGNRILIPRAAFALWLQGGRHTGYLEQPPAPRTATPNRKLADAAKQLADVVEELFEGLEIIAGVPWKLRKAVADVRAALEADHG